jgi:hypothetical protein
MQSYPAAVSSHYSPKRLVGGSSAISELQRGPNHADTGHSRQIIPCLRQLIAPPVSVCAVYSVGDAVHSSI